MCETCAMGEYGLVDDADIQGTIIQTRHMRNNQLHMLLSDIDSISRLFQIGDTESIMYASPSFCVDFANELV